MLFIHYDQSEIRHRREYAGARADRYLRLAGQEHLPGVPARALGQAAVQHGDSPAQPIPQYQITALPEGYVETERTDSFAAGNVTYKNSDGDMILLSYTYMHDGAHDGFILDNTDTVSDIRVSGMPGKLILSTEEKNFNRILWIDAAQNLQFTITAAAEESVIIAMAESVSLYDPTK